MNEYYNDFEDEKNKIQEQQEINEKHKVLSSVMEFIRDIAVMGMIFIIIIIIYTVYKG